MRVVIREIEFADVTKSRTGIFGKHLEKSAHAVLTGAQRQVGVDSGDLLRSLHVEFVRGWPSDLTFRVGSNDWKAWLHHEGARAHTINPVRAKILRFPGSSGTMVFKNEVRVPAIKPNRYLLDNLRLAIM